MPNTTDFMGRNLLVERLSAQLRANGMTGDTRAAATELLKRRGQMDDKGKLTAVGQTRNAMTAEERAIDRAKRTAPDAQYVYNPNTNRATRR